MGLAFCTPTGCFLARSMGRSSGNVLLRRTQYRLADDEAASCPIVRNMIFGNGKVYNARWSIERTLRDHGLRIDGDRLRHASGLLQRALEPIRAAENYASLRGLEGRLPPAISRCLTR